jgi:HAD superfamily hydrolase (TIGR01549 family)
MHQSITTIIFDWDGTCVDSAHLGLAAFQKTFAELDHAFPLDIYESAYSPNWYSTYEALGLPREKWRTADELWLKHYGEDLADLIEGADQTLLQLCEKGYELGVVSSGTESRVNREIERSALKGVFKVLVCNEHILNKKPHPEGLELALRRLNRRPDECAYVGDAPEDIQMGKAGHVMTIGVRSTYPSSSRLQTESPDILLESISGLLNHF